MKGKKNKQKKVKEEKSEKSLCLVVCEFVKRSQQSSKLPHCTMTLHIPKTASISCKKTLLLKLLA